MFAKRDFAYFVKRHVEHYYLANGRVIVHLLGTLLLALNIWVWRVLNAAALAIKERLEKNGKKDVRVSDIAMELGESPEKVAFAITACIPPSSLEEDESGRLQSFDESESILTRIDISRALSELESEERALILLRYKHELSQANTGKILSMTQVQVSRKEKKVLEKLRSMLA